MRVRSLGWEDPLEQETATHPSILAWRIPWIRGAWQVTIPRVIKSQTLLKRLSRHAHICARARARAHTHTHTYTHTHTSLNHFPYT